MAIFNSYVSSPEGSHQKNTKFETNLAQEHRTTF